ncbi:hypothetical protein [Thomasclavelia spiroformis]|uniref:hypothetical protein n=1 Tax=Thomasclavelia spiroformis TaxID=29348 RepID=UPI003209BA28
MKINSKLVDIQYLIKFQSKQTYAEALREKGELFMQSVETYINIEKYQNNHGQGDIREAIYFDCVRVGIDHPTYCMYAVTRDSIINGNLHFSPRMIEDFSNKEGYITVITAKEFLNKLLQKHADAIQEIGLVQYVNRTLQDDKKYFGRRLPHFFKDVEFNYQKEFRIVMKDKLTLVNIPYNETPNLDKFLKDKNIHCKRYETKCYYIGNLTDISYTYSANEVKIKNNVCSLPLC